MSTSSWPIGEQSRVRFGQQSSPTALATGATFYDMPYYSADFSKTRPLQDDRTLGAGWNNPTDSRAAGPGIVAATGKMEIPADIAALGLALSAILGNGVVSAGSGTGNYSWAFSSGGLLVPTYSVEIMKAPGQYDVALGAFAKSVAFSFKAGDQGFAKCTIDWGAVDVMDSQSASIAGTPTVLVGPRFPAWMGSFTLGGVAVGTVMDVTYTFTNEYDEDRYIGAATLGGVGLKGMACKVEATLRYTTDAFRAAGEVTATSGLPAPVSGVLALPLSSTQGLTITTPNLRLEPMSTPISGPGGVEIKMMARAEQSATAAMVSATLLNQVASLT